MRCCVIIVLMLRRFKFVYLILVSALVFVICVSFGDLSFIKTQATSHENLLKGWAWSSTIGWISFSCANDHDPVASGVQSVCESSNYQVKVEPFLSGKFSGYAWAPHIGWIRFDPSSPYPVTNPDQQFSARFSSVKAANGRVQIQGWARACAVMTSQTDCTGEPATLNNNGDWDGWIKFSGSTNDCPDYKHDGTTETNPYETCLTADYKSLDGWAWWGPMMGWVEFYPATNNIFVPTSGIKFCETRPRTTPGSAPTCPQ